MWEHKAFQPQNQGLRFITLTVSTYFCPVGVIILEEMNKQGKQNKQISISLGWVCWGHPWGFHWGRQIPSVNLYSNLAVDVAKSSVNMISLVTTEEAIITFSLTY